jgi:hypothetical protein
MRAAIEIRSAQPPRSRRRAIIVTRGTNRAVGPSQEIRE